MGVNTWNRRNGKTLKSIKTDEGKIELKIPRDRNSTFYPVVVKKYEKTLGPIENKIISMYESALKRICHNLIPKAFGIGQTHLR